MSEKANESKISLDDEIFVPEAKAPMKPVRIPTETFEYFANSLGAKYDDDKKRWARGTAVAVSNLIVGIHNKLATQGTVTIGDITHKASKKKE